MSDTRANNQVIHPPDRRGHFLSSHTRYVRYAHDARAELEEVMLQVRKLWPGPLGTVIRGSDAPPGLVDLVRKRDRLSDTVQLFAWMAVEGFVNFYGCVRLGESGFNKRIAKLDVPKRIRALLKDCDGLEIHHTHQLMAALSSLARKRNRLVHPQVSEADGYVPVANRSGDEVPQAAGAALREMAEFFEAFKNLVPQAAHLIPATDAA